MGGSCPLSNPVAKDSIINVPIAESIATNPAKGNFLHGFSLRQGLVKLSYASGSTWMNPVDKITPAAKALMRKYMSLFGFREGKFFTKNGRHTPSAPLDRTEPMAMSLYERASDFLWSSSCVSHVHVEDNTMVGNDRTRVTTKIVK
uniref:Uncharacterized protein n=1 Tax=Cannabis sativa TaxID=3483 RepID=A0A803P6Y7_CANSA